jgi:hypothetical protein
LTDGGRPLSDAEIAKLDAAFRREREMELVLATERHRKMARLRQELGHHGRGMDGLGGTKMQMDTWLVNYLSAIWGPKWYEDKTALRMLKNELPEVFLKPQGTRIQVGYR